MVDRDSKKSFTIPKTHISSKDVLIPQKTDSRNVTELFNDIKSCALEIHFNFRQNECQSSDTIRNPKLQKLFNERRSEMKKNQDLVERFAFHLIPSRDIALSIATDGLTCEQLSFSIDKYLGNPKDGIHLSRRPDVLLASTGAQNLSKFGLLICKILIGKGYATLPSANNKALSAQLHYDHHFCKIQALSQEQRHIEDLLANSLIFCYEHEDMQTLSHPSQILPLAILWYDLKEKFSSELTPTPQESQQSKGKNIKTVTSYKTKPTIKPIPKPILSLMNGTWDEPIQTTTNTLTIQTTPTKHPSQFIIPYPSLYTSFSDPQQTTTFRDPRLTRTVSSSDTIPLSPQNSLKDKSLVSPSKQSPLGNSIPLKDIPFNSTSQLTDPRLQTLKQTRNVFYLESQAVKHALQQQKRLNNYCDAKNSSLSKKTSYTLIPFLIRSISSDEYERHIQISKMSSQKDYSSLYVSVMDCVHFGLTKADNQLCIDLEDHENQLAYEQIQISNQLIEHERQINSQERRLRLREKQQRRIETQIDERKQHELSNSQSYMDQGRQLIEDHQITTSSNAGMSLEVLDFFSYEYRHETRPYVKRILTELLGIFVEKYDRQSRQTMSKDDINNELEVPVIDTQMIYPIMDMDLESPSSQMLGDYDERFPIPTPSIMVSIDSQPLASLPLIEISPNQASDESNRRHTQSTSVESNRVPDDTITPSSTNTIEQIEVSSIENPKIDGTNDVSKQLGIPDLSVEKSNDSNHSRVELVKIPTKETYIPTSPSPPKLVDHHRRSYDHDETNSNKIVSTTRTVTLVSNKHEDNLIIEATNIDQPIEEEQEEEQRPTVKRLKVDLIPSSDQGKIKSLDVVSDDHDYRQDLDERKRQEELNNKLLRSRSQSTNSHTSAVKQSKIRSPSSSSSNTNQYQRRRPPPKKYDHEPNRSSERSHRYPQQKMNHPISSRPQPPSRHQRFNYNHQSVAEHPRFAQVDPIPSLLKDYNPISFNPSNNSNCLPSIVDTNRNHHSSYHNVTPSNHSYYQDKYDSNLPRLQPLMSTTPAMNFPNPFDDKPSNTIERLQMFLQDRTPTSYEHRPSPRNDYPSLPFMMNSRQDSHDSQWPSSRYSSRTSTNGNIQNNQTFSYNDAEQLLTFVQHMRH